MHYSITDKDLMQTQLSIRPFQTADALRCCEIVNSCLPLIGGLNDLARIYVQSKNVPSKLLQDIQDTFAIVCLSKKTIVGFGVLKIDHAEIMRVYVDPAYQYQGAGKLIMHTLEQEAMIHDIKIVRLQSSLNAVSFYERIGYRTIDEGGNIKDDLVFQWINMEKSLR